MKEQLEVEQEPRLAEDNLRDSDPDSRLILDSIPGIVLFMTPTGELEYANRTVTRYFGKTLEQLKHWLTDDTVHPGDRAHAHEIFTQATAAGQPYKFEARVRRFDGVYRWFHCRAVPNRDKTGRIVRWYGVGYEVEDQKHAETLLAGEKQLLEMVATGRPMSEILEALCRHVESTTSGSCCSIVLVDPSGTKLQEAIAPSLPAEFNDAVRGWPLDRLGGPCQVAARDNIQVIMSDVASDTRWRTSWRALAQKHGLRSCWSTPIVSRGGKALGTFALYQRDPGTPTPFQLDIIRQNTHIASIAIERTQRDAALRRSEARRAEAERDLQEMIDTIPTLVATYRPDGSRIFVNQTWLDYTGLPPASAMQAERSSIVHPDDTERVGREWEKSLAEGTPLKSEMRLRRADGAYRWHSVQRVSVRDESGAIAKWYSVGVDIEDRKRSEEALRQSEERLSNAERELQLTIDTIPAFVTVFRPDGEREYVNKTWRDNTGLELADIQNGSWTRIVHGDDQERSDRLWREAIASGQPLEIRQRIRRHDGEYRWHLGRRVPLRDDSGHILRWYSVAIDIEEQKRAEDALRKSEARLAEAERELQLTLDSIPVAVTIFDAGGSCISINRRAHDYTGVPSAHEWDGTIHPDDVDSSEKTWRACIESSKPFEHACRVRTGNGTYRWCMRRRVPLRDETGKVIRWYGVGYDIEDQKHAEEALRESEHSARLIVDGIPGLIVVYTSGGEFERVNRQVTEYFGWSLDDLLSKRWGTRDGIHPDDRPRAIELFKQSMASGEPWDFEVRLRRFDGVYRWFQSRGSPLRDANSRITRWYNLLIDIDERKRAEEGLREAERNARLIVDSIPGLVATFTPDGEFELINQQAVKYLGKTVDGWRSQGWTKRVVHPEDFPRATELFRASMVSGVPFEFEFRCQRFDGVYRWFQSRGLPLRDASGRIVRWYNLLIDIDERKRAEEKTVEAERDLQLALNTIPYLITAYAPDGSRIFANRSFLDYRGLSLEQALSLGRGDIIHPEDFQRAEEELNICQAKGTSSRTELRLRRSDGEYRWHAVHRVFARNDGGEIIRWYHSAVDIEDQKRAQEALRQSEAQLADAKQELQLTIDTIPTLIASYWPNGERDFVSKNWQEYTGISQEEARGKSSVITFHPDRRDAGEDMWRACLASGEPYEADERLRRADGEYRWHWIRRVPLRDESGKIIKWYGVGHDIEHQKQAEAALLNSEARLTEAERELRLTLDSIPTITWRAGANGYVQQLNKRWFEYTGTTHEQVRGWRWKLCVHPDDLDQLVEIGNKYVSSGHSIDSEARLRRFDGEYRWFLFRPAPVRDEAGNVVAWYGTITDIEDRKRAEQKVFEAERELQRTIDNIPVLVGTYSADGTRLSVNKRALEVTGLPAADVPGGVWNTKTFHPDDVDSINAQWRECLAQGEPFEREIRTRVADGTYRAHLTRRVPLRDPDGKVIRWYGVAHDIEDQRRAEQALAASERNLRLTIDTMPAVTWVAGADGSAEFVNQNYLNYVGLPVEQLMGWGWMAVVHPDDLTGLVATWQALLASGEAGETEARLRHHDGAFRWFLFRANPLHDENGRIVKWYGINTDIEDRKRAETLLAGEKQLFERIASGRSLREVLGSLCGLVEEAAADCYCAIHPIDWSGPKFEYGVAPSLPDSYSEPIEGLPVSEELLPCGVAAHQNIQVIAEDIESDPRWQRSSVRTHTLEYGLRAVWSTPIHARDGRVLGTFCVLQRKPESPSPHHQNLIAHATQIASIAIERSRTEAALRRSEAFLAKGQEASSTGTFSFYSETGKFTWSEQLYRIYEFEPGIPVTFELISTRYHPEDSAVIERVAEQVRGGTTDFDYAHRLLMPDGSVKHVHVVAHGLPDKEGRGLEYFGAVQDVTQRRLAEEATEKIRSDLAHLTRVMSFGALTASIAHEVNQPLAGIITNASTCLRMLAADPPNVDGARETARRTIRDGNRAADVITRLRALFRKKTVATETVDLNEATREVVALIFSDLLRNRVSIHVELGEEPLLVSGDRVQLQQVILNLIRNASDAMSEVHNRPRDLLVKAEREEGGSVRLSVRDAGVGLEPQAIERLFDAFYTTKSDGMGIGLSVSRSIIEGHGGKMWAVPNQGPGATFSFSIPQQAESAGEQSIAAIQSRPTKGAHDVTRNI